MATDGTHADPTSGLVHPEDRATHHVRITNTHVGQCKACCVIGEETFRVKTYTHIPLVTLIAFIAFLTNDRFEEVSFGDDGRIDLLHDVHRRLSDLS
ncbi:hypothetical protein D3C85_1751230 [compost metagenome]